MFEQKLMDIKKRYEELNMTLAQPDAANDQANYTKLLKQHADMTEVAGAIDKYFETADEIKEYEEIISFGDDELLEIAKDEIQGAKDRLNALAEEIRIMLIPKDPNDDKNVVMEIRAGTGGDEAALFAMNLLRMYTNYATSKHWKVELTDISETDIGGCKEATLIISGKGVYSRLKFESGGHRVQRIPETESGGRIHTSAATVAVMPEAEEVDIEINQSDLRIDTYRASGAGGQHVNKTESAVRIIHEPTGIMVTCQDEKSQMKNREKAMRVLKTRISAELTERHNKERAEERKGLVGSGDRSARIRTYNFPQGRVSDHRINLTLYKLDSFMQGDLDEIIEALLVADRQEKMK
jgi:peptide chain release factor 1